MIVNTRTGKQLGLGADANKVELQNPKQKINMYDEHPTNTVSLYEFHQTALNRLQVLRKIEFM
jgi:hypothetical protein